MPGLIPAPNSGSFENKKIQTGHTKKIFKEQPCKLETVLQSEKDQKRCQVLFEWPTRTDEYINMQCINISPHLTTFEASREIYRSSSVSSNVS